MTTRQPRARIGSEVAMSLVERVRDALNRQEVPTTGLTSDGYRAEERSDGSVIVRWGHGEPFSGLRFIRGGHGLASCAQALEREDIEFQPIEHEDANGLYIRVIG
jgi:hypothetical protein